MRFLCLAYGAEEDWKALSQEEQDEFFAQDDVLRKRGDLVAAVGDAVVLRAWDGTPETASGPYCTGDLPLAGFGVIEAESLDEAIELTKDTPCARARGVVELRPLADV